MSFAVLADNWVKLRGSEKRDKYLDLQENFKKTIEHESDQDTNCNMHVLYSPQKNFTGIGGLGNKRTRRDYPNYTIFEIGQNTRKSPRDLKRLAIT